MAYKIYTIHGTFAADPSDKGNKWWQVESAFQKGVTKYLDDSESRVSWKPVRWSGANSTSDRIAAGKKVTEILEASVRDGDHCAFICHSHGANVYHNGLQRHWRKKGRNSYSNIYSISIGAPFVDELKLKNLLAGTMVFSLFAIFASALFLTFVPPERNLAIDLTYVNLLCAIFIFVIVFFLRFFRWLVSTFHASDSIIGRLLTWPIRILTKFSNRRILERSRERNKVDPKIYSEIDEVINVLSTVPNQRFAPASAANMQGVSTGFISILAYVSLLYVEFPTPVAVAPRFLDILPDFALSYWQSFASSLPDSETSFSGPRELLARLGLSVLIGMAFGALFGGKITAWLFNLSVTNVLKTRALGRDVERFFVPHESPSRNLKIITENFDETEQWRSMPRSFDDEIVKAADTAAKQTIGLIRDNLAMSVLSGNFSLAEAMAANFQGPELIHSAYFEHKNFPAFIAWILIEKFHFKGNEEYEKLDTSIFFDWYDAIRPRKSER